MFVEEGTTNSDNGFVLTTNDTITLDTTDLSLLNLVELVKLQQVLV